MSGIERWLAGAIVGHRRGTRLSQAVGARAPEGKLPTNGTCVMFGQDFQKMADVGSWLDWLDRGDRLLLLIPPFDIGFCQKPVVWEVSWKTAPTLENGALVKRLAPEIKHAIRGALVPAPVESAELADGSLLTALHRKHPHAGALVVSALPLWSLSLLDHEDELEAWFASLESLLRPAETTSTEAVSFQPTQGHHVLMLHLVTGPFQDRDAAFASLATSPFFQGLPEEASKLWSDLEREGLVKGGTLTETGRELLDRGPYRAFLQALEESR